MIVYRLDKISDDPAFEGFAIVDKTSLLGKRNIYSDFRNFNPDDRSWQPPRLMPLWKAREVIGNVRSENDYPTIAGVPAFSRRAVEALRDLLEPNGEILPLITAPGVGEYFVYHVTTIADVLDNERSSVRRFEGKYVAIEIGHHEFRAEKLDSLSIFRIPENPTAVYVTEVFADRVRDHSLQGFHLMKVWPLPSGTNWYKEAKLSLNEQRNRPAIKEDKVEDSSRVKGKRSCRPIAPGEETDYVLEAVRRYPAMLDPSLAQKAPDAIQSWIQADLERLHAQQENQEAVSDRAFWLAVAWGQAIQKELGWEWAMLEDDRGHKALSVASPDRGYVVPIIEVIKRLALNANKDVTSELLYNMIKAKGFSASSPGALEILG